MNAEMMKSFESGDVDSEPLRPMTSAGRPSIGSDRSEQLRTAVLWITVTVFAIAVLTFLISVNSVISIWFRSQWAPVARSVTALAVIGLCLYVMLRLVRRQPLH